MVGFSTESSSAPIHLGVSKVFRGRGFLPLQKEFFVGKIPLAISLLTKVLRTENESLNFKNPVPKGFYGYILLRKNKTPIGESIPISFREQEIPLFSVAGSAGSLLVAATFSQTLSGGPGSFLTSGLRDLLRMTLPIPNFNNLLVRTYKSTVRGRLVYRVLDLPENPFNSPEDVGFDEYSPSEDPYWPGIPSGPFSPTIEDSDYGGDFELEDPLEDFLDLDFEARDIPYGNPQPWFTLPREWSAPFDLPIVYSEERGNGLCFKQVRTRSTGKPLSPGGVVPCQDWQIEVRVKP